MKLSEKAEAAIQSATDTFLGAAREIISDAVREQIIMALAAVPLALSGQEATRPTRVASVAPAKPKAKRKARMVDYGPLVPKLVDLIRKSPTKSLAPGVVRKALKLSPFQCRELVALAAGQRMVRTEGERRGTVYRLGPKSMKKAA